MTVDFELPDLGEGVAEGEVLAWHVEPGDRVTEDQIVAEVETDKAAVEVPSSVDGVVPELHAEVGEMVAVGDVLISFEEDETAGGDGEQGGTLGHRVISRRGWRGTQAYVRLPIKKQFSDIGAVRH
jgi:pyruvate dehydrogenase E2 component (dihydrolipoamide acetyltransferase)